MEGRKKEGVTMEREKKAKEKEERILYPTARCEGYSIRSARGWGTRGWQSAEWGISANEKQRESKAGDGEKKEWRALEEYSGRVEGETDAAGDVKVNYHFTGYFVLLMYENSCTLRWKTSAKHNAEGGLWDRKPPAELRDGRISRQNAVELTMCSEQSHLGRLFGILLLKTAKTISHCLRLWLRHRLLCCPLPLQNGEKWAL